MGAKAFILSRPALAFAWIVSILALIGLAGVWLFTGSIGNDFGVYFRTANLGLYWTYWHGHEYPFPYMPTMLLWIAPLKGLSFWPAYLAWVALSLWAIISACEKHLSEGELWLLIACPPLTNGLLTGQVSIVLAALMIWACGARNRYAAGLAFAVIASIKPQLAVMVPLLLLLRRDWSAILSSGLAFVGLVALSLALYGPETWQAWLSAIPEFRYRLAIMGIGGFSPAAAADYWGLNPLPFWIVGIGAGAWVVYRCRDRSPIAMAAALGVGSFLASPYSLAYDFVVVAPFLIAAIFRSRISAAVSLSGIIPPAPLLLAGYELVRRRRDEVVAIRDPNAGGWRYFFAIGDEYRPATRVMSVGRPQ